MDLAVHICIHVLFLSSYTRFESALMCQVWLSFDTNPKLSHNGLDSISLKFGLTTFHILSKHIPET